MTTLRRSAAVSYLSPTFAACALLLAASAIGLRPAMRSLAASYAKKSIALRSSLSQFDPAALKSFRQVSNPRRPILSAVDIGTEEILWLDLAEKQSEGEPIRIALFVTYYSDPRDKVPHTPEVCYRQSGTVVDNIRTLTLDVPGLGAGVTSVEVRALDLDQASGEGVLMYLFCANGEFRYDRDQVRWLIGRPGDPYVFFSKIEAVANCQSEADKPRALAACKQLLIEALPALVNKHFPPTDVVKGR